MWLVWKKIEIYIYAGRWLKNLKGKDHMKYLRTDGNIILKSILLERLEKRGFNSSDLGEKQVASSCDMVINIFFYKM